MTAFRQPRYVLPELLDDRRPLTEGELLDALCTQVDYEPFFVEKGQGYSEAKRVCVSCPIAARCFSANLGEEYGFYASSPPQRKKIRREEAEREERERAESWAEQRERSA